MKTTKRKGYGQYDVQASVETQTEPGSRGLVLKNRLGIRRKRDMDQAEYEELLHTQESYLLTITADTRFSARMLCDMHRDWLGDIYEWAGKYRSVEMSKGGFQWPPAFRVSPNMEYFEAELLNRFTPCRPGPLPQVAGHIAEVHAELLLIHPFRDGNGRLARWLASLMALQAGYPAPEFRFEGRGGKQEKARYLEAVKQGYLQNYSDLTAFFREAIERRVSSSG